VGATPAERLALGPLDTTRIDALFLQHILVFGQKIVAHDGHHADVGEIAGRESKVGGCAAENVLHASRRRDDGIERNRTNNQDAHELGYFPVERYLSRISFSFCRVAAGILSRSVRIACANAEPHLQSRDVGIAVTVSRTTRAAFSAFFTSTATTW